jgi:intraflagellar transport protein 88
MTSRLNSSQNRPPTSSCPISPCTRANYTSDGARTEGGKKVLSPLEHITETFVQFLKDSTNSPENTINGFKKAIMALLQESANLIAAGDTASSLGKAKEAETEMKRLQDFLI